jgi:hypothetical protein
VFQVLSIKKIEQLFAACRSYPQVIPRFARTLWMEVIHMWTADKHS